MTLRQRLLWLFAPPLVLVVVLTYLLAQGLLLARLDKEDEQLLMAEASRLRALLTLTFERDADRLRDLLRTLPPDVEADFPFKPELLRRAGFDFLVLFTPTGTRAMWQPLEPARMAILDTEQVLDAETLQRAIMARLNALTQAGEHIPPLQLMNVQQVPLTLVAAETASPSEAGPHFLVGGTFLDGKRSDELQRQLGGVLHWLPSSEDAAPGVVPDSSIQASVDYRHVIDRKRHGIDLVFHDSLGKPQLRLQLVRERHLYVEGVHQLTVFMTITTAIIVLAWVLIYLGLDYVLLRRIRRMHRELLMIGPDSAGRRLSDASGDELGKLGQEANSTLDRLEQSEARDRAILEGMQEGYFELDPNGRLQTMNPAFCRLLGYPSEHLKGMALSTLLEDDRDLVTLLAARPIGSIPPVAARLRRADGSVGHYETRFSSRLDGDARLSGYRGILHDVSGHIEYQTRLYTMAYNDALTGLGNRKAFREHLRNMLKGEHNEVALLFIDLDRFKQVNDSYGHDAGDQLLICMAERLGNAVREPDRAFRLGGDEFTLVLTGASAQGASQLAARLLRVMGEPVQLGELRIDFVTPSIGIALSPGHGSDVQSLVNAADEAMYEAKQRRNSYYLYGAGDVQSQ